ncbi:MULTISPECIES: TraB/GumN family protein [unclassified Sphingomonas]|uniref:TraB/GumN family protein n=1 Tax=unclassified Sphingomonas TaxID=196159 RepID=UPI0026B9BB91
MRLITPLLIAAVIALPGCSRSRPAQARPALFVVRDADTTIWVLGTIHALPPNVAWETPAITRAIDSADILVTEIPRSAPGEVGAMFIGLARRDGLPPIASRVDADVRPALYRAIDAADESAWTLDKLETWAAALVIENGRARAAGASPADGVEAVLAKRFAGRPQRAFETPGSQLALFDHLGEPDQRRLLTLAATDSGGYRRALAAWSTGDLATIARSNDQLFVGAPAMKATLLDGRNTRWSRWITARMRRPGKLLVAVGTGHLAGPTSVVAMLRARGVAVQRVQ